MNINVEPPQAMAARLIRDLYYASTTAVLQAVDRVVREFGDLRPMKDSFTHPNGTTQWLLCLKGTISVSIGTSVYYIPMTIWFPHSFPQQMPMVYVTPTPDMVIAANHPHVGNDGCCYCQQLSSWSYNSDVAAVLRALQGIFASHSPVYAKPASQSYPSSVTSQSSSQASQGYASPATSQGYPNPFAQQQQYSPTNSQGYPAPITGYPPPSGGGAGYPMTGYPTTQQPQPGPGGYAPPGAAPIYGQPPAAAPGGFGGSVGYGQPAYGQPDPNPWGAQFSQPAHQPHQSHQQQQQAAPPQVQPRQLSQETREKMELVTMMVQSKIENDGSFALHAALKMQEAENVRNAEEMLKEMTAVSGEQHRKKTELNGIVQAIQAADEYIVKHESAMAAAGNTTLRELQNDEEIDLLCNLPLNLRPLKLQMMHQGATDAAIADLIYELNIGLNEGTIQLQDWLRSVRLLANQQFKARALRSKIAQRIAATNPEPARPHPPMPGAQGQHQQGLPHPQAAGGVGVVPTLPAAAYSPPVPSGGYNNPFAPAGGGMPMPGVALAQPPVVASPTEEPWIVLH